MDCIIKDQYQAISIAACRRDNITFEVAVAESMAIRWGLSLAKDLKQEKIVFQSDAKVAGDCVNFVQKFAVLEPIAINIIGLLSSFKFSSLIFHSKSCNRDAHNLTRLAFVIGSQI